MSGSGFRGRGFGPRGARTNGPTNSFSGPRFPHPSFNHPRPPHRLPGPDKWIEGPNFPPWQQNKNFHPRSQYRGNLPFRPNGRGRAASGRGIIRFSGPGRPPAPQFYNAGFIRNPGPRAPVPQEEPVEEKSPPMPQTPLLGSEEERQQKISETADKLKQKLSSITEEEITNFWEDDLSVLPNTGSEEDDTRNKGIPELRHEPPELDLTFTDFRDIGRVDCNNSKFDNVEDTDNTDDVSVIFEGENADILSTNNEINILNDSNEESLNILDSVQDNDILNQSDILLTEDQCEKEIFHEFPDPGCNLENLHLECENVAENLMSENPDDIDGKFADSNLDENLISVPSMQPMDDLINEKPLDLNDTDTSMSVPPPDGQDMSELDFTENQNILEIDAQDPIINMQHNDHVETDLQIEHNVQTDVPLEEASQISMNMSDSCPNSSFNLPPPNEEIQPNIICDSQSSPCPNYNEQQKLHEDTKLNNPPPFQPRCFNVPPRFGPRVPGPRCRWTFQQNGKNLFFRGPQRLPFHGNRMPGPRLMPPFKPNDMVPAFDPRAPPPFPPNLPPTSHDSQHHAIVPFTSGDLPPTFDPSEPPPNMRSITTTDSSNRQEILQPPPVFDPRGPPPAITSVSEQLPEFNPQQPPPKIHKQEETLQPPPIFDPRLSSQERSNLLAPLDSSASNLMTMNLMETSPMSDFNMTPVTANFSQMPPMSMPPHQGFMNNIQINFQPILPQTNGGQVMVRDFALPLPPINIADAPPPLPQDPTPDDSIPHQNLSMDDGLEDMQEAMEFAKQVMNMTEEMKNSQDVSVFPEVPITPSDIPVPIEDTPCTSSSDQGNVKRQKKKESKSKKVKQNVVYGPELIVERQEDTEVIPEEHIIQGQSKNVEDVLLAGDQIRPKVVFNLNSKMKLIQKTEEWRRPVVNVPESRETQQTVLTQPQNHNKERTQSKRRSSENDRRKSTSQDRHPRKERSSSKKNSMHFVETKKSSIPERTNEMCYDQNYLKDLEKLHPHSSNATVSNSKSVQKNQKSKKGNRKGETPTLESSWKNRVISRFLKMSKNDICNMVNNSSLRKFDIAMKHLVKERRSSLSLEMRNTEDEKMKEYDREEFMSQLNAMLDPGAVVGITDLPTEFIHHLSEVLQLDPMPFEAELPERQTVDIHVDASTNEIDASQNLVSEFLNEESLEARPFHEYTNPENVCVDLPMQPEDVCLYNQEEPVPCLSAELNLNISRRESSSSRKSSSNRSNPEVENTYKMQQPLFNEADLDNILSEVTEKTKNLPNTISSSSRDSRQSFETYRETPLVIQTIPDILECSSYPRIPTKTAADLDDIFSAGIARVKKMSKNVNHDNSRTRKSSSEDRNPFRSERYERWNRKEREDLDAFRNLTKEEWEAKYGSMNTAVANTIRKNAFNSVENLSRDRTYHSQRYCSSDSPMRHLSVSPLTREAPACNPERQYDEMEETRRIEQTESSSDSSTSSTSDSDEETVAPNVTKLLKVIKEKEKIAKKKSLNETIRDEVAAEIEKKWKEKSKHKERKSRKREKRKRDRRERRKREKRRKRKRNSYSDSSRSSDQSESFRLLTEDEIKKEVIVKEEPVSSWEENASVSSEVNSCCVSTSSNRTVEPVLPSRIDSRNLQVEEQVTCDKPQLPAKGKPVVTSVVQTKTKAQLKQMPESSDAVQRQITEKPIEIMKTVAITVKDQFKQTEPNETGQKQIVEKPAEAVKNSISITNEPVKQLPEPSDVAQEQITEKPTEAVKNNPNIAKDSEKLREQGEKTAVTEVAQINNEKNTIVPFMNNLLNQSSIPSNVTEVIQTESVVNKNTIANSVPALSTSQSNSQKPATGSSTESRSGYRKIDIKAYKERRMREQAKLKESSASPVSVVQDVPVRRASPMNKTEPEPPNPANQLRVVEIEKVQIKDPRLAKAKAMSQSWEPPPNKEIKEKPNLLEQEHRSVSPPNKGAVQFKDTNEASGFKLKERGATRLVDSEANTIKNTDKHKDHKSNAVPLPEEPNQDLDGFKLRAKTKMEIEEKGVKKSPQAMESSRFKNIRSEGSKELKLKKERAKKSSEKKKKSKSNESKPLVAEKQSEKHSHDKPMDEMQKSLGTNANNTVQTDIDNSCDTRESSQSEKKDSFTELRTTFSEALSNSENVSSAENSKIEHNNSGKMNEEEVDTCAEEPESNKKIVSNDEAVSAAERLSENQKVNQIKKEIVKPVYEEVPEKQLTLDQDNKAAPEKQEIIDQVDGAASEKQHTLDQVDIVASEEQEILDRVVEAAPEKQQALDEINEMSPEIQQTSHQVDKLDPENQQTINQIDHATPENQQIADKSKMMIESSPSLLTFKNEENNFKETEENAGKITEPCTVSSESVHTEKPNEENKTCDDTPSVSIDKCIVEEQSMEIKNLQCVITKPENTETIVGKEVHSENTEALKRAAVDPTASVEIDSKVINEESTTNSGREEDQDKHKSKAQSQKNLPASNRSNKSVEQNVSPGNTVRSPDSTGSPFKGFLVESVEDEICQVSALFSIEIAGVVKENTEDPKKWLETCLADKSDLDVTDDNKRVDGNSIKEQEGNETIDKSTKEQSNVAENDTINEAISDHFEDVSNLEATTRDLEAMKESETYDMQRREASPIINIDSQDTFDDDSEPFIVLDEYIDDTDGKSIEKLSTLDLDLEDCIARDAEIFSSKAEEDHEADGSEDNSRAPNFNAIDFKELSEVLDKKNDNESSVPTIEEQKIACNPELPNTELSAKLFSSTENNTVNADSISFASEFNTEPSFETMENSVSADSTVPEIPKEFPLNGATSEEPPQESLLPDVPVEMEKTEQQNFRCTEMTEKNSQHSPELSEATRLETPMKENTQTENTVNRSTEETTLAAASTLDTNVEVPEPSKQRNSNEEEQEKVLQNNSGDISTAVSPETGFLASFAEKDKLTDSDSLKEKEQTSSGESSQKEALHKIKNKSKMKQKKQKKCNITENAIKEAVKSDTVKIKYPSTKEAIMARMIEIDVEIHKLMTEKMTLYDMLTTDALPEEPQQSNVTQEKETEIAVVRPRTPSALMSQLIQNIETSPVTNQCAKTAAETVSLKDNSDDSVQSSKHKISAKQEYHTEKKGSLASTGGSDDEEVMSYTSENKSSSSKKRKKQKSERTVKWNNISESNNATQEPVIEKKQTVTDTKKSILKKGTAKSETTERDSDSVLPNESRSQESTEVLNPTDKEDKGDSLHENQIKTTGCEINEKAGEPTQSQPVAAEVTTEPIATPSPVTGLTDENSRGKIEEKSVEASNEKGPLSLNIKVPENRTPERSSIYSDDSTWDSLLQNPSGDDQKRLTTGLALLEETYRKEMAKSRRIRAEARKRRRKKIQNASRSDMSLTPEEEELPLSTLYVKKLHTKKKSSSQEQRTERTNEDLQVWKNVDEVINAVAENRTEDLYVDRSEGVQSTGDTQSNVPDADHTTEPIEKHADDPETSPEPKPLETDEKQTVSPSQVKSVEEVCEEPSPDSRDVVSCEGNNENVNDSKQDDLQLPSTSSKLEGDAQILTSNDIPANEEQETDAEPTEKDLPGSSACGTFVNVEKTVEPREQETIEKNIVEINQVAPVEDVDECNTKLSVSNESNNEHNTDIPETDSHAEKAEEGKVEEGSKQDNLPEEVDKIERNISTDVEKVISMPETPETNDNLNEPSAYKDVATEETAKENSNSEIEAIDEETLKDLAGLNEREAEHNKVASDNTSESSVSKDERISLGEHRSQRRRESESSSKASSEENNNRNRTSVSESQEASKIDESSSKKLSKRKRGSSRTPLRRSSRNTEEVTKRVKKELGGSLEEVAEAIEQEVQEKSLQLQFPSVSPTSLSSFDEEAENTPTNTRKSRSVQKTINKKGGPPEIEVLPNPPVPKDEPSTLKQFKRSRQHSMSQMLNCEVRLVDSKHTILKPDVNPDTLRKYGISVINSCVQSTVGQVDFSSCMQSTSIKESTSMKRAASVTEFPQGQQSKLMKRSEDIPRLSGEQTNISKIRKAPKPVKVSSVNDKEESEGDDVEVMPVLTKEQFVVDISQDSEKPDIEIVEERVLIAKSQQKDDSGSIVSVIETRDEKEVPRTQYTVHKGPILDIKVFENSFLAASEDGRIYRYSQASNGILNIYKGHKAAVTCLYVYNTGCVDISKEWMFSGSLDGTLRCYNITSGLQVRDTVDIGSPIQCMDEAWGIIFIGTKSGHVSRYHMKSGVVKGNSIQFSDKSVLALKATNEGPRRVLIVASRSQPITIRDAQNGLFLRTICGQKSHTVYSLMRDNNLIYCGTSSTSIPVFDFTNGEQTIQYDAGVGIVCMRLYKKLLFAGCYDGNIYIFDTKDHRLICSIPGPGNMLLSMEVIDNKIIAGSKDKRLQSWQVPWQVRDLLALLASQA